MRMFLLLFVMLQFSQLNAAERDINDARNIAKTVLHSDNIDLITYNNNLANAKGSNKGESIVPYYIFCDSITRGLVIVSHDLRMKEVLGISYCNSFDAEKIPCGLKDLLEHYKDQYINLDQTTNSINTGKEEVKIYQDITPLIKTRWGQDSPYNDNNPAGCPCGCVATAMSQIMAFYKYPLQGTGTFSYISQTRKYYSSFDFSVTKLDWDNIYDTYTSSSSSTQSKKAVATLVRGCGVSVGMDYDKSGSGAYGFDVPYALINYFKYNKNIVYLNRSFYKNEEWYNLVHKELENGRPILYCGSDLKMGGHAFVIDGFRKSDGKFHVNWGWDGNYDGFFELDALNPSAYSFSSSQSMIAGIQPATSDEPSDIFYAEQFTQSGNIEKDMTFNLKNVYNFSNKCSYVNPKTSFTGYIGIALYDRNMNLIEGLDSIKISGTKMLDELMATEFHGHVNKDVLSKDEEYYICPFARYISSSKYTRIRTFGGLQDSYIIDLEKKEDDHDEPSYSTVLVEGFNKGELPEGWRQTVTQGATSWYAINVLSPGNNRRPLAKEGRGYLCLEYNSGSIMANIKCLNELYMPALYSKDELKYKLSFAGRKYSERIGNNNILCVYLTKEDGTRQKLIDKNIQNMDDWCDISTTYIVSGAYQLSIETSIENSSFLFLDDLRIELVENGSAKDSNDLNGDGKVTMIDANIAVNSKNHSIVDAKNIMNIFLRK